MGDRFRWCGLCLWRRRPNHPSSWVVAIPRVCWISGATRL
jgi:hypothetical protein